MKPTPRHNAFTLIEILVAISIITILLAIGIAAMSAMYGQADISKTQIALEQLEGARTEYIAFNRGNQPAFGGIASVLSEIRANGGDEAVKMLNSISNTILDDGSNTPIDPWGNPIVFIGTNGQSDGGGVTGQPQRPSSSLPYFASRGPDGEWGTFAGGDPTEPDDDAKDNLFSFQSGQ